jgi:hypothetical protein
MRLGCGSLHEGGFDLSTFGAVRAWLDRVAAEPRHLAITA